MTFFLSFSPFFSCSMIVCVLCLDVCIQMVLRIFDSVLCSTLVGVEFYTR